MKYPVRLAINPLVSSLGWYLPLIFSGSLIVATVLNLPTIGPLLLRSLISQDMFLAGTIVLIYFAIAVIGTLLVRHPAGLARSPHPHGDLGPCRTPEPNRRMPPSVCPRMRMPSRSRRTGSWSGGASRSTAWRWSAASSCCSSRSSRCSPASSAPRAPHESNATGSFIPVQRLHFWDDGPSLFVYGVTGARNPRTLRMEWQIDESRKIPLRLLARGYEWQALWLIPTDLHLIGPADPARTRPFICWAPTGWAAISGRG